MSQSTKSPNDSKPVKPYEGFPLFPHATGRWAKKIRQKFHYFGKIADDPLGEGALEQLNHDWPWLSKGLVVPVDDDNGCTLGFVCNKMLTSKKNKTESGELALQSFSDYYNTCERMVTHFGPNRRVDDLGPDDFERFRKQLAKRYSVVTLTNEINRCRIVFTYAFKTKLIKQPVDYGEAFEKPSTKMLRQARNEAGPRMFEAKEIRQIIDSNDVFIRAMTLLGVNCGFGNTDCASLPQSAINMETGWIEFPRPKTAIQRRIPLWPETIAALRDAILIRPSPKNRKDADLCFITNHGNRWVRVIPSKVTEGKYSNVNTISRRFSSVLKRLKINGRNNLGFYTLRHVFETIGGESRDQVAVDSLMGHADGSMASHYRERISDERLRAVVDTVHAWLWPPTV